MTGMLRLHFAELSAAATIAAGAQVARLAGPADRFPEVRALTDEAARRHATPTPDPDPRDVSPRSARLLRPSEPVCLERRPLSAKRGTNSGRA